MQEFILPYNHTQLTVHLPDTYQVDVLLPQPQETPAAPESLFAEAFSTPVGRVTPIEITPETRIGLPSMTRPALSPRRTQ